MSLFVTTKKDHELTDIIQEITKPFDEVIAHISNRVVDLETGVGQLRSVGWKICYQLVDLKETKRFDAETLQGYIDIIQQMMNYFTVLLIKQQEGVQST